MRIRARIATAVALALLLIPDTALAGNGRPDCDGKTASQQDECKGKRDKPKFQSKFFGD